MRAPPFESLSMNFASPPTKPDLLEPGIIGVSAQNRRLGLDSGRPQLFNTRFRIYAQVAQSVEQRTENTENSRGKFKNRNGFLWPQFSSPELFPNLTPGFISPQLRSCISKAEHDQSVT
jgi:hypothetical protein